MKKELKQDEETKYRDNIQHYTDEKCPYDIINHVL